MAEPETFRGALIRLRRAPSAAQLANLRDVVAPGARVARVRRLPGGLQCGMHAVDLLTAQGQRLRLVVRRYTPQQAAGDPGVCRREWDTLRLLERAAAAAPRPVFLDDEGAVFGTPTLVMTRLPGRAFVALPARIDPWLEQFTGALGAIHAARVDDAAAAHLPRFAGGRTARQLEAGPETDRRVAALPRGAEVLRLLREHWPPAVSNGGRLLHGDFFSGNTVWYCDRLSGVVDWGDALIGPPELDLSSARLDLSLLAGPGVADRFLACCVQRSGRQPQDLTLWDLSRVWGGALLLDHWWQALHEVGTPVTRQELGARFEAFALAALARAR
jgi:aminoglycoside phosphotransferase (APT) family kinase protein